MEKELWVLIHSHEYGASVYPFWYEPTEEFPAPDTKKVAKELLEEEFEPEKEESLSVTQCEMTEARTLTAEFGGDACDVFGEGDLDDEEDDEV